MTPYKQAFAAVIEDGSVFRIVVMGEDPAHGEGSALSELREYLGSGLDAPQVWDLCAFPTTTDLSLGVFRIYTPTQKELTK